MNQEYKGESKADIDQIKPSFENTPLSADTVTAVFIQL